MMRIVGEQMAGYTLLASSGALIVNPLLESNIPWSVKQFVPIARFV